MSYFRTQPGVPTQTMVAFGEWLPDDDRNIRPGFPVQWESGTAVPLQDAKNVIFTGSSYRPLGSLGSPSAAIPSTPTDIAVVEYQLQVFAVAGSAATLYASNDGGATWPIAGTAYTAAQWSFTQYGSCIYATNNHDPIQVMDLSSAMTFSALAAGTAPVAAVLGTINDFLVAGNISSGDITGPWVVQWSALANPAVWSLPNTQDARANQSGAQSLDSQYGAVTYIANGEQMGLVFQQAGITRVQYVGGDVVFSFYTFERKRGLANARAAAQAGNVVYFLSADGFYATDGSGVDPIGYGKVNRYFLNDCSDVTQVRAAIDSVNQVVMWSYPSTGSASGWRQLAFNYIEKQWTHADYAAPLLLQGRVNTQYIPVSVNASNQMVSFTGAPTDCEITTKDFRFDPSAHALVTSVRILTDGTATAGVAARDQDTDAQNFVGYLTPETISRTVSVRADGYMHAVNVKITSDFGYCQGVGIEYVLRGSR